MKLLISIDWDFFIPSAVHYWNKQVPDETTWFLMEAWKRAVEETPKYKNIKTSGLEKDFWKELKNVFPIENATIHISESHKEAYHIGKYCDHALVFDSHHDCYSTDSSLDCANWLYWWMMDGKRRAHLVEPEYKFNRHFLLKNVRHKLKFISANMLFKRNILPANHFTDYIIHICRSGCWSPPWLDTEFVKFIDRSQSNNIKITDGIADPLTPRKFGR